LDKLYAANCAVGRLGKNFESLDALSTRSNLAMIERLMEEHSPVSTLEIGMAFGASSVVFAAMHQKLHAEEPGGTSLSIRFKARSATV